MIYGPDVHQSFIFKKLNLVPSLSRRYVIQTETSKDIIYQRRHTFIAAFNHSMSPH